MKFLEMLKNLFKGNKQYEVISQTLACLNDIVPMPKRTDFHNNQSKLDEIDFYIAEYLKLLKLNKTITSIDLMPEYLHKYKNIYTDLLLNLCIEDDSGISFDLIEDTGNYDIEQLNIMIKCIKLMLYQQEVEFLEEKTRIRLVALNEILENLLNGRLFTRVKSKELIHSLLNEISNLHSALIVFMNQRVAMKMESENYLKNLSTSYNFESIDVKDNSLIEERLKELRNIFNIINPEELKRLESMNLNPKLLIATIEQKLEIYVYTHPETLESLKKKVREISYEVNRKVTYDFEDENTPRFSDAKKDIKKRKNQFLSQLQELEILYKVFSKYGRNLVKKDDLRKLYEVKFKILTSDILDVDKVDILSNATFTEYECYQEIIFKKIEDILKGKNQNVNFFIPGGTVNCDKSLTDIIGYIAKTLKDGENEFSPYKILQDKKLLSLLLAFDEENGLADFFEKNYVSLSKYTNQIDLYDRLLGWEYIVPLKTLYKIMRVNIETDRKRSTLEYYIDKCEPLYYIFYLYEEYYGDKYKNEYYLPEGIWEIDLDYYFIHNIKKEPHIKRKDGMEELIIYIRNKAQRKPFILPKTMKRLKGDLFCYTYTETLILNEGLEKLGANFLESNSIKHVEFPSTLEEIFPVAINLAQLKTITIRIKGKSAFFEKLIDNNQLSQCFKLEETKEIEDIEGNKRDEKEFKVGDLVFRICKLVPTFDELIFLNEFGEKIIYTKEMLELVTRRKWKIGLPIGWEDARYLFLTQEDEKLITDKFREIYCNITEQKYITGSDDLTLRRGYCKK